MTLDLIDTITPILRGEPFQFKCILYMIENLDHKRTTVYISSINNVRGVSVSRVTLK